ncbi:MAG TPA: hypothetical protein PKE47_02790 [Verrucomicrobiota bacterium]|nr:hypothetical protein [Verrucomicrobiota bacterium]
MLLTPHDHRRRRWGLAFVLGAAWLTAWGLTLLEPRLRGWGFILYWLGTAALAGLAFLPGLLDWWILRHRRRVLLGDDPPERRE